MQHVPILWAAAIALLTPGLLALTPFWLDLWNVLILQWLVFVVAGLVFTPFRFCVCGWYRNDSSTGGRRIWRGANF